MKLILDKEGREESLLALTLIVRNHLAVPFLLVQSYTRDYSAALNSACSPFCDKLCALLFCNAWTRRNPCIGACKPH